MPDKTVPSLDRAGSLVAHLDREQLERAVFELAKQIGQLNRLSGSETSHWADLDDADDILAQRISAATTERLAEMLSPFAWLSITVHRSLSVNITG